MWAALAAIAMKKHRLVRRRRCRHLHHQHHSDAVGALVAEARSIYIVEAAVAVLEADSRYLPAVVQNRRHVEPVELVASAVARGTVAGPERAVSVPVAAIRSIAPPAHMSAAPVAVVLSSAAVVEPLER